METETYTNSSHLGRKIERIRRLRGMNQTDLGELLGVTKQAKRNLQKKLYYTIQAISMRTAM